MNLKSADFETAARMLSRVTTPYEITEKMSQSQKPEGTGTGAW
jgi:hypothetical protein